MPITILHDASGVLAITKPAGLPTQAPSGIASVEAIMREQLFGDAVAAAQRAGQRRHPGGFLGVPHRLDRAVSGVLLLATTPRAARQLSRQFERRQIGKTYLAILGSSTTCWIAGDAFEWRDMIRKVPGEARAEIVPEGATEAREAVTTGQVLVAEGARALLALEPRTGRMHQLRVQAAARGMPVVGDGFYGGLSMMEAADERSQPIALHAWRIRFADPDTGRPTEVVCPLPPGSLWEGWSVPTSG
jgi:23S rRNA-/tRNA-specific pseudouridylate synthase